MSEDRDHRARDTREAAGTGAPAADSTEHHRWFTEVLGSVLAILGHTLVTLGLIGAEWLVELAATAAHQNSTWWAILLRYFLPGAAAVQLVVTVLAQVWRQCALAWKRARGP